MGLLLRAIVVICLILLVKITACYDAHILEYVKYLFLLLNHILYISKMKGDFVYVADELF